MASPPPGPHSLALAEAILTALPESGLPQQQTTLAFRLTYDRATGNEQRVRDAATRSQHHAVFQSLPAEPTEPAATTPDGRRRAAVSGHCYCGWRVRTSRGVAVPVHGELASPWRRQQSGRSSRTRASTLRPDGTARLGRVPALPGASHPGAGLLHRRPARRHQGARPRRYRARSRRVLALRATEHPVQSWEAQQARNLLLDLDDAAGAENEFNHGAMDLRR
jgi:hypothetical protein